MVAGGSLVAFFWTVFPSPLTDRTWLRMNLATSMYVLGNYFSAAISTFESRLAEEEGVKDPTSPATHHLSSARRKTFEKIIRLVSSVESHIQWQRWEPAIGGRFPAEAYGEISMRCARIMGWISLMSYALTRTRQGNKTGGEARAEAQGRSAGASDGGAAGTQKGLSYPEDVQRVERTHRAVLAVLGSLSSSLLSGRRLPPLATVSHPHGTIWRPRLLLDESIPDSPKPVPGQHGEDGIVAGNSTAHRRPDFELNGFFITELCIDLICDDVDGLRRAVRSLVGEVDFSVRVDDGRLGKGTAGEGAGQHGIGKARKRR